MMHAIPKAVIVQEYTPNSLDVKYLANVKVKTNLNMKKNHKKNITEQSEKLKKISIF